MQSALLLRDVRYQVKKSKNGPPPLRGFSAFTDKNGLYTHGYCRCSNTSAWPVDPKKNAMISI